MNLLIKSAKIIDPTNVEFNNKIRDVYIEKGIIKNISKKIDSVDRVKVLDKKNLHLSPGWFDCWANFNTPGMENRETIETGIIAASKGGFTSVSICPNTNPVIDNASIVKSILEKVNSNIVNISVIGALTKGAEGRSLADIYEMNECGVIAFGDGKFSKMDANTFSIGLNYVKGFEGLVMSFPNEYTLSKNGQINESKTTLSTGLKGIPNVSETINLFRDISLTEYNKSKIHISSVSCKESLELIENAKNKNLDISCHVTPYNLLLDDSVMADFDSYKKVYPPIREVEDRDALRQALKNNIIDFISSEHTPLLMEEKMCPFADALFGSIGLESSFGAVNKSLKGICELDQIINFMSINPRKRFNINVPKIEIGQRAEITFFDPSIVWTFQEKEIRSKSRNSIFLGQELLGKPIGIFNNDKLFLDE